MTKQKDIPLQRKQGNSEGLEDLIQTIGGLGQQIQALAKQNLITIRTTINQIVKSKSRNPREIEPILDTLLDYAMWGIGNKEFQKLNGYYSKINPQASADYRKYLEEVLG